MPSVSECVDERWGRRWAADPANGVMLTRLVAAVEDTVTEERATYGDMPRVVRNLLDGANRDAAGAGTWLAGVLADPDGDAPDRQDARDFWEAAGGAGDDEDRLDELMYGSEVEFVGDHPEGCPYGDGPLVGFVVGAVAAAWGWTRVE